jgi:hypothetical protein
MEANQSEIRNVKRDVVKSIIFSAMALMVIGIIYYLEIYLRR